ncbi:MAG: hypothetical protein JWN73_3078 [Betaproteobacteria bacterium]|nr:hypothetical protein [Betaproteobacteria bacterium]
MAAPLQVLFVADKPANAAMALCALKHGGLACAARSVRTADDFVREMTLLRPDVILAELPFRGLGALSVLTLAREHAVDTPVIFLAMAAAEGQALQALQAGAADYVLNDNLNRLHAAVLRAVDGAVERVAARRAQAGVRAADERFQAAFAQAAVGIAHVDAAGRIIEVNQRLADMLGYESVEMAGMSLGRLSHRADMDATGSFRRDLRSGQIDTYTFEKRFMHKDGRVVWMRMTVTLMPARDGQSLDDIVVFEDVTADKREAQILQLEHGVATCLADATENAAVLKAILCAICKCEGWEMGRYFCLDESAGLMRYDLLWGKDSPETGQIEFASRGLSFSRGEGLVGAVWQSGESLWMAQAGDEPEGGRRDAACAANLHVGYAVPASAGGAMVGVMVFSGVTQAPDARLMRAMRVIGGQVGQYMERRTQQRHIARLNRIYKVLSGINSLIVRAGDRGELFREACRIAVDDGRFSLAWLGMVDRRSMQLEVAAAQDTTQGYMELIPLGLTEDAPGGLSLAGRAIAGGKPVIINNIEFSSLALKAEALAQGLRSMVALPLLDPVGAIGVLCLYADTTHFFDQEEMKLLQELAGDISFAIDHLEKAERLNYLAYYDALTGFANRTLFLERVGARIETARVRGQRLAVMVVDIDRFKLINESLGRAAGDLLLQQVAGRFPQGAADQARYARIGADQFAVVIPEVESEEALALHIEGKVENTAGKGFNIGGTELRISARMGVTLYPDDAENAEGLLANALSALKRAKTGGEKYVFYRQQMSDRVVGRLNLESQLRQALERGEFVLHYQPKMHLASRRIESVEALIRWNSPQLGLVPPVQFISLMEQTGLILEVGAWALRQAAADYCSMLGLEAPPLRIAVNVSPIQLRRRNFVDMVQRALGEGDGAPGIDLEITESLMMEDIDGNIDKLMAVRALGLNIAIDDFGTGYSSLGYLARLPADALKIDRSFIISMLQEPHTLTLVATIISLAHTLNLQVIAEGVDSMAQLEMLASLGCDQVQGFLISRPLPLAEMLALKRDWPGLALLPGTAAEVSLVA